MNYNNNAVIIKRDLLVSIIKLYLEGKLEEEIDRIPWKMTSGKDYQVIRCCVSHDRAILRTRIVARLGFSIEEFEDDGSSLADWVRKAIGRDHVTGPMLTVLDDACNACIKTQFLVTNACQGCLARPCQMNCPKKAVSIANNHADIDKSKCVNCGICLQSCPFHAIIKIPVPCEESCPVGAITKDEYGKERVDYQKCVFCGNCTRECPFGAMMDKSQIIDVLKAKKQGRRISVMIAPAIAGQFRGTLGQLTGALKKAGFDEVYEVALGADITARKEAKEFAGRMEQGEPFMTTSCCPAYMEMVKKHLPALAPRVSDTRTPMHYTAEIAAREHPEDLRVFIGPCLAKRKEGIDDPLIDYVLTAEEIGALFTAMGIDAAAGEEAANAGGPAKKYGRNFPWSGGVAGAVQGNLAKAENFKPVCVNGFNKEGLKTLKEWAEGRNTGNILEVMACAEGCIAGPMVIANPKIAINQVKKLAESSET
ncbi:MAG: monomeric [FeFe] hydrogenase [Treponema sp.]|jgi:[FeFe] hydrogenase (group B1/B3)|nr:monomeric [FeFe] hydrogenase [Treponema sp.]